MFVAVATLAFILSTLLEGTLCEDEEAFRIPRFRFRFPKIKIPKAPKLPKVNAPKVEFVKPSLSPPQENTLCPHLPVRSLLDRR
ncbi:hypothetical protein MTO96_026929 [Rhipicephalus appendiculatus]